ncbi:MAG: tRNA uridine-5-carboxymethylaminomethyl(34) synthesis enzyme MnmG [Calditerrivibrio sp.]|nr:tRNA uridine-5-carboxymethylaminomethyl(34) synthesis enzyme MnmG [Calditerrivibrio sp.]
MISYSNYYDVVVVGAGHAGIEAALVSARMGAKTLLLTIYIETIAQMSCNPAIGGLAKGCLVKDIDALGGEMGKCIDATGIQFRILNKKKGPAVRSSRAQADKKLYRLYMTDKLMNTENLFVKQAVVTDILAKNGEVIGVECDTGYMFTCKSLVLTTGTFLNGLIYIGDKRYQAGRANEFASTHLSDSLKNLGFDLQRLKTGTPARLHADTINWDVLEEQKGDNPPEPFSFETESVPLKQVSCFIAHTNEKTHEIIRNNMHRSPLYSGVIQGIGPRYCPSIEDKVKKFPDKSRHQIFLEPEGLDTKEIYANGFSSSLPIDVQIAMYRSLVGLENVEFIRPAYAIEYDFVQPTELYPTLETKKVKGLFFAGQINGTTGYEEAAAQGIVAGINAVLSIDKRSFTLGRDESFIGVMIDDLVTKGVDEPYRMFHSRAEYRLLLREDNAEFRLIDKGYAIGTISASRYNRFLSEKEMLERCLTDLSSLRLTGNDDLKSFMSNIGINLDRGYSLLELLKRPEVEIDVIKKFLPPYPEKILNFASIRVKYEGYIKKQEDDAKKLIKIEKIKIPEDIDYSRIVGLRREYVEKLNAIKPKTLGQALRIKGMTPAAVSLLHIYIKSNNHD